MYFYSALNRPNGFNELHGVFLWAGLPYFMRLRALLISLVNRMSPKFWLISAISICCAGAQTRAIQVTETAGIRRPAFPTDARVHFARGVLPARGNARLLFGGSPAPAQFTAETLWPDGSVEWLDVDWNVTIGPGEAQSYTLEYGARVIAAETPRGLAVTEDSGGVHVGSVRLNKAGSPLLASVKYRGEDIGQGLNGLYLTDDRGQTHDLSKATSLRTEIVKRGPLLAVIRYTGSMVIDGGYSVPFVLTVEMPNSKSMVKILASIEDPARRLREIAVATPLALGPLPWVWDFGTSRWTYGQLRNATDSVTLTQEPPGDWTVRSNDQLYETSPPGHNDPIQWGHIQDGREVVAFILERHANQNGTWRVTFQGDGQAAVRFTPAAPSTHHEIAVYEHFVTSPVQIGAATSPISLLSPLKVEVGR